MENPSSDINHHRHHNGLLDLGSHRDVPAVSPLEQEVLNEYARLALNMESLSQTLTLLTTPSPPTTDTTTTATSPPAPSATSPPTLLPPPPPPLTHEMAESLRLLERKVASVYTLMKASVYSIVLQQGEMDGGGDTLSQSEMQSQSQSQSQSQMGDAERSEVWR